MKTEMSSFDILAAVNELLELEGARLNKVYQVSPQELKILLSTKLGRQELVIETGRRIHLTEYPKPSPEKPSTFAMTLRKHLENAVLTGVKQVAFDRIVELSFRKGGGEFNLIAELFGNGNVVLTDKNKKILAVMKPHRFKTRSLVGKAAYEYPPQRFNPTQASKDELMRIINESKSDVVRALASPLGLGGLYAEEVCLRAGIEKNKEKITDEEASRIFDALSELKNSIGREKPVLIFDGDAAVDVVPLKLRLYEGKRLQEFESFNKAADEYFTKYEIERVESLKEAEFEKEISKIEARLEEQKQTLEKYKSIEEKYKEFGDIIYVHFKSIQNILAALFNAKKRYSWEEIAKKIEEAKEKTAEAGMIKKILPKERILILEPNSNEIKLDLKKSAAQNADFYYAKSKKSREKIAGVEESIRNSEAKIRELKERGMEAIEIKEKKPEKRKARKKEWYEKFRWFVSSDSFLVLGGRDAASNETLVKKHVISSDVFVHADIHGAPAVIIKTEGKEVPEATMQEAFDFAASYSKAWKYNIFGLDVYWVNPEQVSKTAEHGEYVAKGAFVIRGRKNFGKGKIDVAVGVKLENGIKVIGGPTSAVEKQAKYSVRIVPGRAKSREVTEKIKSKLLEKAGEEDREKIRGIALEEMQEFLPGGGSDIRA